MRKVLSLALLGLFLVLCLQNAVAQVIVDAELPEEVVIPDVNLEMAIRDKLNKPIGVINENDMASIQMLYSGRRNIIDLTGLEYCTSMWFLYLEDNYISDVSPLADLIELTSLNLRNNFISNINSLSGLIKLTSLALEENFVSDISALQGMTQMEDLTLPSGWISDISSLANLTKLTELELGNNKIQVISALTNLTNLRNLDLRNNAITNITPLTNLTDMKSLDLSGNNIVDIGPLANMTYLTSLYLDYNQVANSNPLGGLTYLAELRLRGNQLSNVDGLANLVYPIELELGDNNISDISGLSNLIYLMELDLHDNEVTDISPLTNLTYLRELQLSDNQITNISPLANLDYLRTLELENNQIQDISALENLPSLMELELEDNQISDIAPLVNNPGIGRGDWVDLDGNPLSNESCTVHIPALEARGVDVDYDCDRPQEIAPITDLTVSTGATGNVVELQWTAPGYMGFIDNAQDSYTISNSVRRYTIKYNTVPVTGSNWEQSSEADDEPLAGPPGSQESMAIVMPYPNVVYYFAIRTEDEDSTSSISNSQSAISSIPGNEGTRLYVGWNMVSFMGEMVMPIAEAMSHISDQYISVWFYDASIPGWRWYSTNGPVFFNTLNQVKPGGAYWIDVIEECTWYFGGNDSASPALSAIPRPPFVLYGEFGLNGSMGANQASSIGYPIDVSVRVGKREAGSYVLDSNPMYGSYYVIQIPVDGGTFRENNSAQIYVNGTLASETPIRLGGIGVIKRQDINYMKPPQLTRLLQNYPNPFNPETWIPYQLSEDGDITIRIYSTSGKLVRELRPGYEPAGIYISKARAAYWDGRNEAGEAVTSGIYFYSIQAGAFTATRKMAIAR